MTTDFSFFTFINGASLNIRDALNSIVTDQNVSRDRLSKELGIDLERLDALLDVTAPNNVEPWVEIHGQLIEVLTHYGVLSDKIVDANSAAEPTENSVAVVRNDARGDVSSQTVRDKGRPRTP